MNRAENSVRTRKGTAQRKSGRKTAVKIVEAAYQILMTESYKDFTLRNIAQKAGVRLYNVQYYYKTPDALLQALQDHLNQKYFEKYEEIFAGFEGRPEAKLTRYIEFHMEDCQLPATRHFFLQLWPLMASTDNYSGEGLNQLYRHHLDYLTGMIRELAADIAPKEAHARAILVASLFEGLMVTAPRESGFSKAEKAFTRKVIATALAIAKGNV